VLPRFGTRLAAVRSISSRNLLLEAPCIVVEDIITHIEQHLPAPATLYQNYPNPFNPTTTISFDVEHAGHLRLDIYTIIDQKVRHLMDNYVQPGSHHVVGDGREDSGKQVTSGLNLYQLEAGMKILSGKMTFIR